MRKLYGLIVVALFATVFLMSVASGEEKRVVVPVGSDGVQRVEVLGGSYFFDPNYIVVKVNMPVEMKIRRESGMVPHNIVLKASEAGMDINEGMSTDPKIIKFTPTNTGKFQFICDKKMLFFESHKDKGMVGTLEVVQ